VRRASDRWDDPVLGNPYAVPGGLVGKIVRPGRRVELGLVRRALLGPRCRAGRSRAPTTSTTATWSTRSCASRGAASATTATADDLFPTTTFRRAWEELDGRLPPGGPIWRTCAVLKLAARPWRSTSSGRWPTRSRPVSRGTTGPSPRGCSQPCAPPALATGAVDLAAYDALLGDQPEADR